MGPDDYPLPLSSAGAIERGYTGEKCPECGQWTVGSFRQNTGAKVFECRCDYRWSADDVVFVAIQANPEPVIWG